MSDQNALVQAQTTTVGAFDENALAQMLGIDRSAMEAERQAAAQLAAAGPGGNRKVDTTGMVIIKADNMGRFSPTYPGKAQSEDRVFRTFTAVIVDTRFWPARVLKEEKEGKNGETETKYTTDCELKCFALPSAVPNEQGEYPWVTTGDGKLKGYLDTPEFGLMKTVQGYHCVGTKHGVCETCEFAPKDHPTKCKITGHLGLLVIQEGGKDVGVDNAYLAALRPNYTSTISYKAMMDKCRDNPTLGDVATQLIVEIGLEKNAEGKEAFYQLTFRPVANVKNIPPEFKELIGCYTQAAVQRFGAFRQNAAAARQIAKAENAAAAASTAVAVAEGQAPSNTLPF